jgi:hypothetical protein
MKAYETSVLQYGAIVSFNIFNQTKWSVKIVKLVTHDHSTVVVNIVKHHSQQS